MLIFPLSAYNLLKFSVSLQNDTHLRHLSQAAAAREFSQRNIFVSQQPRISELPARGITDARNRIR